jgi:hypothetical protein
MNEEEKKRAQALIAKLLKEAADKAATGEYRFAVTAAKKAKALDQGNVFLLALERQLEQLNDLQVTGTLTDAQKTDILESVPRLVDQATSSRPIPDEKYATPGAAAEAEEARLAAGRWLKNQYFQRAHEYVRNAEYEPALAELRKIFTIDDQDRVAREFEMKITQMIELQRRQPPVKREEAIAPPQKTSGSRLHEELRPEGERGYRRHRRKSSTIPIAIGLTLVAIALAVVFFIHRSNTLRAKQAREATQENVEDSPVYHVPPSDVHPDSARGSSETMGH